MLLGHCAARNLLERLGWRFITAGDWAIVLRDPTDQWAARISPFELAYQHYVKICRELPDNRYTPEILLSTALEGGGHLVIMELLTDRNLPESDDPDPLWESSDPELRTLRSAVEEVDRSRRESTPWWGGIDVKNSHFMRLRTIRCDWSTRSTSRASCSTPRCGMTTPRSARQSQRIGTVICSRSRISRSRTPGRIFRNCALPLRHELATQGMSLKLSGFSLFCPSTTPLTV